jgi:shikimate kinase
MEVLEVKKAKAATPEESKAGVKIFLIGMMGSGKSYWAEKLKKKFKVPCYDLDSLVEMMEERTIAEIFQEDGEEAFRKLETKMLKLFSEKKQFILSCGGGTPCFNDNMKWMNKNGITIFLDEPVDTLAERLLSEKEHRPLIKNMSDAGLQNFLDTKRQERLEFYNQATFILKGEEISEAGFKKIIKQYA